MRIKDFGLFTRLIRTRPLFLAALLYLTGCILGYASPVPMFILALAAFLLLAGAICIRKRARALFAVLLLIAMLPLGALRFETAWNRLEPLPDQRNAQITGRICKTPAYDPEDERTICVLEEFQVNGGACSGRLRLYLRGDPELLQSVRLGQQVSCEAHIWRADGSTNPGQFNFSNYLRINGLRGYATVEIKDVQFSEPNLGYRDLPERIRAALGERIDRLFPRKAALARAFLIGDRSMLSDSERESYSISGAAHLLAISGMHISVLAAAIGMLLGRFTGRRTAFLLTLVLLLIYGCILGFSASLFRAILMYAVFCSAPLAGRYSDAPTRIAAAMLLYIIIRPTAILEAGFILSYGASAGIIFLYAPLSRLFHVDEYISKRTDVGFVSFIRSRLPRLIVQSLLLTCAAQIAILPAIIHFYGAQPVWSFAVNLIAAPLAMAAYILSIIGLLTGIPPLASAADLLFSLLTQCVQLFSALPLASLRIARFPLWLTLLCAVSCLIASDISKLPERLRRLIPFAVIPAILIANLLSYMSTLGYSVVFLNAGQADCAVIRTEGRVYLVDTGDAYSPAADYLSAMNYTPEAIFLSHPHTDHAGGLDDILDVCTPRRIYISANWHRFEADEMITDALDRASEMGCEIVTLSEGDAISLSDKTLLEVLSPSAGFSADSANDDSLILRVSYGQCSAVFCGDAPASTASGKIGDIDLLKVAHHGGNQSLNTQLLQETSPAVAVIPVGYNSYGHPARQTMDLLEASGAKIFRTDLCGAITCRLNADGSIRVQTHHTPEVANGLE